MHQQSSRDGTGPVSTDPVPGHRTAEQPWLGSAGVLLVDDHQVFAELLAEVLSARDYRVLGISASVEQALVLARREPPDVVVLDHALPSGSGAEHVAAFLALSPRTRVLMLTGSHDRGVLTAAMSAGCHGFVTKSRGIEEVLAAVEAVLAGGTPVSADVAGGLLGRSGGAPGADLSSRERQVLLLLADGRSTNEIAAQLRISVNTVRNHVQHVLAKLGAHSKLEAVAVASRLGLLQPPGPR